MWKKTSRQRVQMKPGVVIESAARHVHHSGDCSHASQREELALQKTPLRVRK
jgi:hypothetical protein